MITTNANEETVDVWIPSDEQIVTDYLAPFTELLYHLEILANTAEELNYPIWARAAQMDEARALLATMDRITDMMAAAIVGRCPGYAESTGPAFVAARSLVALVLGSSRLRDTIQGRDELGDGPIEALIESMNRAKVAGRQQTP